MRIFVTGASGYIGSAVVAELLHRGHHVAALARSDAAAAKVRALGAHVVHGGMDSLDVLELAAREHDATISIDGVTSMDEAEAQKRAVVAMLNVAPKDHTFVYTSGCWVYGDRGDAIVDEQAPLAAIDLVAWRPAIESLVLDAAKRDVRAVVIRPGVVYGDNGGIVGGMVQSATPGPVRVVGNGENRWPLVRVDALAELYVAVIEQPAASGIYNATRGAAVPYVEIARAASRAGGSDGSVEHLTLESARGMMGAFADALALDLQISSDRAKNELGWEPHRPTVLEELANTVVI